MNKIGFLIVFIAILNSCSTTGNKIKDSSYSFFSISEGFDLSYDYTREDGSLDWDVFYIDIENIPSNHFVYFRTRTLHAIAMRDLYLLTYHDNDYHFIYMEGNKSVEVMFSLRNYYNANEVGWMSFGNDVSAFNEMIKCWNIEVN